VTTPFSEQRLAAVATPSGIDFFTAFHVADRRVDLLQTSAVGGGGGMIQIPLTTRCAAPRCWTIACFGVPE